MSERIVRLGALGFYMLRLTQVANGNPCVALVVMSLDFLTIAEPLDLKTDKLFYDAVS